MFIKELSDVVGRIFESQGLDPALGQVRPSDRPELSDFQCNGALQAAKALKRNPREIAQAIQTALQDNPLFSSVTVDGPGFLNFRLNDSLVLEQILTADSSVKPQPKKILIDYGGPNVAKPLHVGHLRSAIIGESLKRLARNLGHDVIGDIHMGDWGKPMGLIIAELEERFPEWPYFQDPYVPTAETKNPPFDAKELNSLYPLAAKKAKSEKDDTEEVKEKAKIFDNAARLATAKLQKGHPGYRALWKHFVSLSVESIKKDFSALDVDFDLWLGESDADPYIDNMIADLLDRNIAVESEGALVINVAQEGDTQEIPPLMLRNSDGGVTYATTDLATIWQRVTDHHPDKILYVVDNRQSGHFTQVFRAAIKAGYTDENVLEHIAFGTMNGKDGKPFKTREGGVMKLSDLIQLAKDKAAEESGFADQDYSAEVSTMLDQIAIAAIKFGDLSNPRTSDYIFEPAEFVRFEGKTGPYLQYTVVRANAVLAKNDSIDPSTINLSEFSSKYERDLAMGLANYEEAKQSAMDRRLPSDLCDYAHKLARTFNGFYKNCPIGSESDESIKGLRLALTQRTANTITEILDTLAIATPEKMLKAEVTGAPELSNQS